jgi:hypothetical protein
MWTTRRPVRRKGGRTDSSLPLARPGDSSACLSAPPLVYCRGNPWPQVHSILSFSFIPHPTASSCLLLALVSPRSGPSFSRFSPDPELLVDVLVGSYGVAFPQGGVQQLAARKKEPVVKQQPRGEYERCEETCPPPGISASPSEIWCAARLQYTSQTGCSCRLFLRKRGTTDFEYAAEATVHVPRQPDAAYVCWCTKKKGE